MRQQNNLRTCCCLQALFPTQFPSVLSSFLPCTVSDTWLILVLIQLTNVLKKEESNVPPRSNHLDLSCYVWADARWRVSHVALKSISPFSLLQTVNDIMYIQALAALSNHSASDVYGSQQAGDPQVLFCPCSGFREIDKKV